MPRHLRGPGNCCTLARRPLPALRRKAPDAQTRLECFGPKVSADRTQLETLGRKVSDAKAWPETIGGRASDAQTELDTLDERLLIQNLT